MRLLTLQNNEANSDQALQEIIYELDSGWAKTVTVMNPRENRTFSKILICFFTVETQSNLEQFLYNYIFRKRKEPQKVGILSILNNETHFPNLCVVRWLIPISMCSLERPTFRKTQSNLDFSKSTLPPPPKKIINSGKHIFELIQILKNTP